MLSSPLEIAPDRFVEVGRHLKADQYVRLADWWNLRTLKTFQITVKFNLRLPCSEIRVPGRTRYGFTSDSIMSQLVRLVNRSS
jgi:hypothetical protein